MRDIVKSQLYSLKKNSIFWKITLAVFVLQSFPLLSLFLDEDIKSAGAFFAGQDTGWTIATSILIFVIFFTGMVCADDFHDKTANYELMSGHTRKEAYLARVVISIVGGLSGAALMALFDWTVINLKLDWGTEFPVSDYIVRLLLCLFPLFRVICEFIFISYLVKDSRIIMGFAVGEFFVATGIMTLFAPAEKYWLGIINITKLLQLDFWRTYTMENLTSTKEIYIYESAVSAGDMAATIVVSLAVGLFFLVLGYSAHHRDDII